MILKLLMNNQFGSSLNQILHFQHNFSLSMSDELISEVSIYSILKAILLLKGIQTLKKPIDLRFMFIDARMDAETAQNLMNNWELEYAQNVRKG